MWGARLAVLVHVHMEDGAVLAALVLRLCLDVLLPLRVRLPAARPAVSATACMPGTQASPMRILAPLPLLLGKATGVEAMPAPPLLASKIH